MIDAWWYAVWPDPRSRSRSQSFWSSKNCTFPSLSPPPFTVGPGKWPLILKLEHNIYIWSGQIFTYFSSYFLCHRDLELGGGRVVSPSTKFFSNFIEVWYVDRGRWLMYDGPYDSIQGQGQGFCVTWPWTWRDPVDSLSTKKFFRFQWNLICR